MLTWRGLRVHFVQAGSGCGELCVRQPLPGLRGAGRDLARDTSVQGSVLTRLLRGNLLGIPSVASSDPTKLTEVKNTAFCRGAGNVVGTLLLGWAAPCSVRSSVMETVLPASPPLCFFCCASSAGLKTITINQKPSLGLGKMLRTRNKSLSILNNNALELPAPCWLDLHDAKNQ